MSYFTKNDCQYLKDREALTARCDLSDGYDDPIIVRLAIVLFWLAWLGVLAVFWAWVVKWLG